MSCVIVYIYVCVCDCMEGFVCVDEKHISWNLYFFFFCSLHLHFCAYFVLACETINALDLNGSFHFMSVRCTAALGSCSNILHVMWLHYACVYVHLSWPCLTAAYMALSMHVPVL